MDARDSGHGGGGQGLCGAAVGDEFIIAVQIPGKSITATITADEFIIAVQIPGKSIIATTSRDLAMLMFDSMSK
ncbi:hypothetical protein E2562_005538 [Oryza meyeriana var. granulata]|uniref:Uncharacterized protein n=1 Tax=Oryza meyeriana var. granulata TaxID=110450 RepID=A0A6G1F3W6_9ORYZ|nr:hypothetical protein E2562_005538 [Oryza meyeriana var. granulata]